MTNGGLVESFQEYDNKLYFSTKVDGFGVVLEFNLLTLNSKMITATTNYITLIGVVVANDVLKAYGSIKYAIDTTNS